MEGLWSLLKQQDSKSATESISCRMSLELSEHYRPLEQKHSKRQNTPAKMAFGWNLMVSWLAVVSALTFNAGVKVGGVAHAATAPAHAACMHVGSAIAACASSPRHCALMTCTPPGCVHGEQLQAQSWCPAATCAPSSLFNSRSRLNLRDVFPLLNPRCLAGD